MSYDAFPAHESTRKRRRWGCTCGCLAILILLLIGGSIFTYSLVRPNKQVQRNWLMDDATDGFGVVRLDTMGDDGVRELSKLLIGRIQKAQMTNQDPNQAKVMASFLKVASQFVNTLIQRESFIYLSYDAPTADESAVITTPLKNSLGWVVLRNFIHSNMKEPDSTQSGNEVYSISGDDGTSAVALSISQKQIVVSDSQSMLSRILTYSADPTRYTEAPPALQQFIDELALDQPVEGQDLALAVVNEESRIANFLIIFEDMLGLEGLADKIGAALASQKLSFNDITGTKITGDLQTADKMVSEVTLYCRTSDMATKLAAIFRNALSQVVGQQKGSTITLSGDARARGSSVVVELEIGGIKGWIHQAIPVAGEDAPAEPAAAEPAAAPQ